MSLNGRDTRARHEGGVRDTNKSSYGEYISRISRIAPEAERAEANITAMTVPLGGARRPQITNVTVNQKTSRAVHTME